MIQPTILLLREGTDTSQGKAQVISNINACAVVVDAVRTTLGPCGMDKLIVTGGNLLVTNDGATVLRQLDVVHPAAKTLVEISRSQDDEVGDGTTSVVVIAGELLAEARTFVEDGVHPQVVVRAYRKALELAKQRIREIAVPLPSGGDDAAARRRFLENCAATALQSKLVAGHKEFFARMVVDAVTQLDPAELDVDLVGIKKEPGGSLEDSFLIEGVAFKKCFSYAGFEQQPKSFTAPKILCLNLELELKAEKDNAEIRVEDVREYQSFVDAEWRIIYNKLDAIVRSGANIVLSRLAIGDLATQYFADRKIFCAGRVAQDDLMRVCKATGAAVQTTVSNLVPEVLGTCGAFEERQIGQERYNLFSGCPHARSTTIVLRGGGEQFIDEAERSLHDAIMVVRRCLRHGASAVVAGAGAIEMELATYLTDCAMKVKGKEQLVIAAFARALEVIPRQLADNAGFDSTAILNLLRQKHTQAAGDEGRWYGVDIQNEGICDAMKALIWEPSLVRLNALTAATEAACVILSVDETIKNAPKDNTIGMPPRH